MTAPRQLDSFTLTDETDFADLARNTILGRIGGGMPHDSHPVAWVFRAYRELEGSPYQEKLAQGVAACLEDGDPVVRLGALIFFGSHPTAPGAERIITLVEGGRSRFGSEELSNELMSALGAQIGLPGCDQALVLARREALEGDPDHVMAALTQADADWVIEHAEAIVEAHPTTGMTILFNLQKVGGDVAAVGQRIAGSAKRDPTFSEELDDYIRDDDARALIRQAMGAP